MDWIRVTEPLGVYFDKSGIPATRLEMAADRGTEVHAACAAYARKLPVWVSNGAYLYFQSFRGWFDKFVRRVFFVEEEFRDETYRIVGHPDIGVELVDDRRVVVDYKTPQSESKTWRAQVAAYRYLVEKKTGEAWEGMALKLDDRGGDARAIVYKPSAQDFAAYTAALTAYRYFK